MKTVPDTVSRTPLKIPSSGFFAGNINSIYKANNLIHHEKSVRIARGVQSKIILCIVFILFLQTYI